MGVETPPPGVARLRGFVNVRDVKCNWDPYGSRSEAGAEPPYHCIPFLRVVPLPADALAQRLPVELGLGVSGFSNDGVEGTGLQYQVGTTFQGTAPWYQISARLLIHRAEARGVLSQCRQARPFYCLGRRDHLSLVGASASIRVPSRRLAPCVFSWLHWSWACIALRCALTSPKARWGSA